MSTLKPERAPESAGIDIGQIRGYTLGAPGGCCFTNFLLPFLQESGIISTGAPNAPFCCASLSFYFSYSIAAGLLSAARNNPRRPKTVQGDFLASAKSAAVAIFGPPVFCPRRCKAGLWPQAKTGRSCRLWALISRSDPGNVLSKNTAFRLCPESNRSCNHRREKAVDPGGDAPASPTGSPGRAGTERQRRKALPGGRSRRTRLSSPRPRA